MKMSDYDHAAWEEIQAWRDPSSKRSLLPAGAKSAVASGRRAISSSVQAVPGSTAVLGAVEGAVGGLLSQVDRVAVASVNKRAILAKYRGKGPRSMTWRTSGAWISGWSTRPSRGSAPAGECGRPLPSY
jgi:hypothetical protein